LINHTSFVDQHTEQLPVPLVPEIKLHLAHEALPLWQKTEEELGAMGLPPPFWAFAWAGGQALARYILDHPELVRNKAVLDLASGSGLVAIAAKLAGASSVLAADIDTIACAAIALNAKLNNVELAITSQDLLAKTPDVFDLILVGDLFYEQSTAASCMSFLKQSRAEILIGDPGRAYLPKDQLTEVSHYEVPVTRDLEDTEIKRSAVWKLRA